MSWHQISRKKYYFSVAMFSFWQIIIIKDICLYMLACMCKKDIVKVACN